MSVNWSWKNKIGYLVMEQTPNPQTKVNFKVNIYEANCLGALIYEFKDKETNEDMYKFWGFWNDEKHLKNCLGLTKEFNTNTYNEDWQKTKKIVLNTYYKDALKIGELFAKSGIKVELHYKKPKGVK